jgi:pimeloyl-ACP methyl ester carboxylesterase
MKKDSDHKSISKRVAKGMSGVQRRAFLASGVVVASIASGQLNSAKGMSYFDNSARDAGVPSGEMRKQYVDTALGQVHYRIRQGSGVPIICFHQTASSSAMFEKFAASYAGSEPIIAMDTPGFGGSFDPLDAPTMPEAIKALGYNKVHLFGHHTGACVAIEIAIAEPDLIESLMMIGPVILTPEERAAFASVYPKPFQLKADGSHLQIMWDYVESIGGNSTLELHHREMVDTARAWQGHIKMYSKIWDQDFGALYTSVSCPMLVMCAEKDILWPMFSRATEMRPDASAVVIPGTNFEPDEAPLEVSQAIQGYLTQF